VPGFLIVCMPLLRAQNMTTAQYIARYKDIAIVEMQRSGIPASITLAQGVLETQSGNGWLVLNSNNHFGIKCKNNWTGETVHYDDDASQECFRKYPNAEESYKDHSDFLKGNPRYAFLFQFQEEDYKSWAYGLKQAGYATSKTYPEQLIKIIEDNNLQQYTMVGEGLVKSGATLPSSSPASSASSSKPATAVAPAKGQTTAAALGAAAKGKVFEINDRKVIYVAAGTALIKVANDQDIRLRKLVKYNDLAEDEITPKDMLIFLQNKGRSGKNDFHVVQPGETMYDIAQVEGIQLRWLRRRNHMEEGQEPAVGEKLALAGYSSGTPKLAVIPPKEDPTEGDLHPGQIVKDVKTEIEKQQAAAAQQQQQQQSQSNLPAGMVDDLKKAGATVSGPGASVNATVTAPAATATVTKPVVTAPSASVSGNVNAPGASVTTTVTKPVVTTPTTTVNTPSASVTAPSATVSANIPAPSVTATTGKQVEPAPPVGVQYTAPSANISGSVNASAPSANVTGNVTSPAATMPAQKPVVTATASAPTVTATAPAASTTVAAPAANATATAPNATVTAPAVNATVTATTPQKPVSAPAASATVSTQGANTTVAAPAASATVSAPGGDGKTHEVQTGDTLYNIAKRYKVTVEQLREWNHLPAYDIRIGQKLIIAN
jgi:LysM repeat protein